MRGLSEYPGSQLHTDIDISLQFIFSNDDTVCLFLNFHMLLNVSHLSVTALKKHKPAFLPVLTECKTFTFFYFLIISCLMWR